MSIAISCDSGTKWKLYPVPGFPNSSVGRESACNEGEQGSIPRSGRPPGEGIGLPTPVFLGFRCGSAGKESVRNEGDLCSIPGLRRSPGEGKCYPLQFSGLENSMDCIIHGLTKNQTQLSDFHFCFHSSFLSVLSLVSKWYFLHSIHWHFPDY